MKLLVLALALASGFSAQAKTGHRKVRTVRGGVVYPAPAYPRCSTAGDETVRPVFGRVNGKWVVVGYECKQDNRGGGGGGATF